MNLPGAGLRRFAARVCSDRMMARVVDPVAADIGHEYVEALRQGASWRARVVLISGTWSLLNVTVSCVWADTVRTWRGASAEERRAVWHLHQTLLVVVCTTSLLLLGAQVGWRATSSGAVTQAVYLLPNVLVYVASTALMLAVLYGLPHRQVSRRICLSVAVDACLAAVVCFLTWGWLMPWSASVFQQGGTTEPTLTPWELRQQMYHYHRFGLNSRYLSFHFYTRIALSFAPAVLAALALALVRRTSLSRMLATIVAMGAVVTYGLLQVVTKTLGWDGPLAAGVAVWLPNVVFLVTAAAVAVLPRTKHRLRLPEW